MTDLNDERSAAPRGAPRTGADDDATDEVPGERAAFAVDAVVPDRDRLARAFFWVSALSIPASTVIVVAALSHMLGGSQLAAVTAIFGASFVGTVLPIGAHARAGADAAAGGSAGHLPWRPIVVGTVIWVAVAPGLAVLLDVPMWAMLSPALGLIPSMAVGVGRGELIGQRRFVAAGSNYLVEAAFRLGGGIGLASILGANGAALSLVVCQIGAWLLLPRRHLIADVLIRLPAAFGAAGLMILSVQIDVLIAPRLLGVDASVYDTSALPSKGVFLAMASAAWLVVPDAMKYRRVRGTIAPLAQFIGAGLAISLIMTAAAPLVGAILGQPAPDRWLLLTLGLGMALASGNWVLMQIRFAQAPRHVWIAPAVACTVIVAGATIGRSQAAFCAAVVVGQLLALAVSLAQLSRALRGDGVAPRDRDGRGGATRPTGGPGGPG